MSYIHSRLRDFNILSTDITHSHSYIHQARDTSQLRQDTTYFTLPHITCHSRNCNDQFSRFEQQILFLKKQAEATNPTTERHGHDGTSWARRTVEGVSSQNI